MARRAISAPIVRQRYAADAEDGDTLPLSAPRLRRTDAADATDWGTLQMSAPRRRKTMLAVSTKAGATDDEGDGSVQASAFKVEETGECGTGSTWQVGDCLLYTSPSPRDQRGSRMPSSA